MENQKRNCPYVVFVKDTFPENAISYERIEIKGQNLEVLQENIFEVLYPWSVLAYSL